MSNVTDFNATWRLPQYLHPGWHRLKDVDDADGLYFINCKLYNKAVETFT